MNLKNAEYFDTITCKLTDFLVETEALLDRVDKLTQQTIAELYDMYEIAARVANVNITEIDPAIRVMICKIQDIILERVIDIVPQMSYQKHSIYIPAIYNCYERWTNVHLLKDCGLSGYMLAKEIGARPIVYFGTKPSDYPYLLYLPGMEILYSSSTNNTADVYYKHLTESYTEMDVLILHGMYDQNVEYLNVYRKLRPDGKVYCGLDMNSHWMNRIPWDNESVKRFAGQCSIIATSCRLLRDELNRNPNICFSCHWLSHGFFNPTGNQVIANPECKENIILTVGRIGTVQKNNTELLLAFSIISNFLPEWKLRLVGSIEPEFQPYINHYFTKRPDLRSRVIFTGMITAKEELYKEYARAKIFVLTSQVDGGAPNVYAEALFHGCMFITSDIDGADDITNYGKLGLKYKLGDIEALATALLKLCYMADIHTFKKHIPLALNYAKKYFDWNRNAKKLAFMLYREQLSLREPV